jgi:uncharacterized ion transporter superfamily protein YfcC
MNYLIIIGIVFFLTGLFFVIYAGKFGEWFARYKFTHNMNYMMPEDNKETSSMNEEEYIQRTIKGKGFYRGFWLVWLTGIRVIGLMLTLAGIFLIIHEFLDS